MATPRKDPKDFLPRGQPTQYKPEYCEMLIEHCKDGSSFESFSCTVGTHRQTLYNWCDAHPEFFDARKKAKDLCAKWWETLGKAAAVGKIENFNATAFVWMTKNICGYRDKNDMQITGPEGGPLQIQPVEKLSDAELQLQIKELATKALLP